MKDHITDFIMWSFRLIIVLVVMALFGFIMQSVTANAADNLPACMTLQQARAKYPTTHLWWYYDSMKRKCWGNRRGGPRMRDPVMSRVKVAADLNAVRWYPQPFDADHDPVAPPFILNPADHDMPGNILWSEEPNEIDKLADRPPFLPWDERIEGALVMR